MWKMGPCIQSGDVLRTVHAGAKEAGHVRHCEIDSRSVSTAVSDDPEKSMRHLPSIADAKVDEDAVTHSRDIGIHGADDQQPARLCCMVSR